MRGFTALTLASGRMAYRSPATLRVGFVTPLVFVALIAVYHQLRFNTGTEAVDFFDYIATGVAAWYITYTAQHGMTGAAAGFRAQGVLKRIAVTPISSITFIVSQVLARLGLAVVQAIVVLGAAKALGASIDLGANLLWALVPVAMIVFIGLSIGFIWAGITRTPEGANTLDVMAAIPILFMAGALWPREGYPEAIQQITDYANPFVPLFDMLRGIALDGRGLTDFGSELLLAAAWLAVLLLAATRAYKLKEA
jgi:ABC-2 type transport system permease protein